MITKYKHNVPWAYVIGDVKGEETVVTFYKKEFKIKLKRI